MGTALSVVVYGLCACVFIAGTLGLIGWWQLSKTQPADDE